MDEQPHSDKEGALAPDWAAGGRRPTIVKVGQAPPKRPSPTIIKPASDLRQAIATPDPSVANAPRRPTAIPGTHRKGVELTPQDLAHRFPGMPEAWLAQVQRILERTVPDTLNVAACATWAEDVQKQYAQVIDRSLRLTGSAILRNSERHLGRLYAILQQLADAQMETGAKGLWPWGDRQDPEKVLEKAMPELNQLRDLLAQALPELIAASEEFEALESEAARTDEALHSESLAAQYLADQFQTQGEARLAQILGDRSASLIETAANLQQGALLRRKFAQDILALVARIQDGVLTALPAWIESLTLIYRSNTHTDTDRFTLRQGLDGILQQLR